MIMVTNNVYDALENLLLGDTSLVKIDNVAPNTSDKVYVTFSMDNYSGDVIMMFTKATYDDDLGLPVNKNKMFKLTPNEELMNVSENPILDTINYILEQMQDNLNECYGIIPIGTTKFKNSNCFEFTK